MVDHVRRHIGLGRPYPIKQRPRWQRVLLLLGVVALFIVLVGQFAPTFALLLLFLAVNILLEQHKTVTERAPVDIEILSVGVAFLSAVHGFGWGLALALIGPIISHASIAYFGDATMMKLLGHVGTAVAAALLGTASWQLMTAICIGALVQYCAFVFILGRSPVTNVLARATTLLFSGYIVFLILPHL